METLTVQLHLIDGGWLEAVILEWQAAFARGESIPDCDKWLTKPTTGQTWAECIKEHRDNVADTLAYHGYKPKFIENLPNELRNGGDYDGDPMNDLKAFMPLVKGRARED
jgi:hypothetical protein